MHTLKKWPSPTFWIKSRHTQFLEHVAHEGIIAEIGVHKGEFSDSLLRFTNPKKLYLIDCWEYQDPLVYDDSANTPHAEQEKLYQQTLMRFAEDSRVEVVRKYSKDAVNLFENESLDLVYIDANHAYDAVKDDLNIWWPKVKKGGMLSGHDYFIHPTFGVIQAVNEFLIEHNLYFSLLTTNDYFDSWAIQKPS
jgi:hypothetical protein